jgi:hypothetical protein
MPKHEKEYGYSLKGTILIAENSGSRKSKRITLIGAY